LCLSIDSDHLCVKPFQAGDGNQQWFRDGAHIRNRNDKNKVLDIMGNNKEKGAKVGAYAFNGGANQSWEIVTVGKREFHIVSELNSKVLDVAGNNKASGAKVVMYTKKSPAAPNQLWYLDNSGHVRSCLSDMALSNGGSGQHIHMEPAANNPRQQWKLDGKKVVNGHGECLDINGANKNDDAELISYSYNGNANQHWRFEYL
jgi:hypothetical protein